MADPLRSRSRIYQRVALSVATFGAVLSLVGWKLLAPRGREPATEPVVAVAAKHQSEEPRPAFEPTDWALWPIAVIYIGVIVLLIISCVVLMVAYPNALSDASRTLSIAPPGPRLQTDTSADLRRLRAKEEKRLNSYYWVDKQKGIVHIPIEQAIKKLAATGAPGFPKEKK